MANNSCEAVDTGVANGAANGTALGITDIHLVEKNDCIDDNEWIIISKRDGKVRILPRRMIFVGREECDIVLRSTTVDKRHAVIFFNQTNHQFHIKDLNTSYGTYLNDKRIADQCYVRLQHSDRLRFGFGSDLFTVEKTTALSQPLVDSNSDQLSNDGNVCPNQTVDNCVTVEHKNEEFLQSNGETVDGLVGEVPALISNKELNSVLAQCLPKSVENTSNSSLSTIDSLDDIKTTKHKKSKNKLNEKMDEKSKRSDNHSTHEKPMASMPLNASKCESNPISTSGPATAFIIAFEDEVSPHKKKMNIKDSIRQFAPPKPDSIEKPRPSKSAKVSKTSDSKNCDSIGCQKSPTNAANALKLKNAVNTSETTGHLSDSATYLIGRMLSNVDQCITQPAIKPVGTSSPTMSKCLPSNGGEKDSGVSDDKSETGTYTIESEKDQNNQDLELARKKIDEVFGVHDDSTTISLNSSPDSSLNSPSLLLSFNEKNSKTRHSFPSPKLRSKFDSINCESSEPKTLTKDTTFTRTKRRAPTVEEMLHRFDAKEDNDSKRETNDWNKSVFKQNSYNTSHKSNDLSKVGVSLSAPNTPRSPLLSRKIVDLKANRNNRKNSWSHSNSDFDCYESYNSDESTDRSHKSSNSALSKDGGNTSCSSGPSKMRFNRAFALRRARLGIETPGIDINKNVTNNAHNNTKPNTSASKQPMGQKYGINGFNRSDGGRFSLRVGRNDLNNSSNRDKKSQNISNNRISTKENTNKNGLQRKGSDPSGAKNVANRWSNSVKSCASDTERNSFNTNLLNQWNRRINQTLNNKNKTNNCLNYDNNSSIVESNGHCSDGRVRTPVTAPRRSVLPMSNRNHMSAHSGNESMSASLTEPTHKPPISSTQQKRNSSLELTALDSLVVSAINQLSTKLRTKIGSLLESQRSKCETNSEAALMIDEILPQLSSTDRMSTNTPGLSVSRDLSTTLKNLKKLEQSIDIVSSLMDPNSGSHSSGTKTKTGFFVVDI